MDVNTPFLQSLGSLPDCSNFSNMMERSLATISANCISPLPSLCNLLHIIMKRSCTIRFPWRTVSFIHLLCPWGQFPRGFIQKFLEELKVLKFSLLTPLFLFNTSIKNMSIRAWSLQPRLPVVLTSLISSSVLACNKPSNTSPLVRVSHGLRSYPWCT